ncbi:MAG: 1-aminocyclopropane-1-carboxylate deaminase/D-cysteine desulfhydrase [Ignavibacteriae bacterium]|nr:1-aminocyclopropane-1-carboxylate deaminase/D-cysteine desulfhydrase [Ignavibacteriota bacterium]MCB9258442.1 1-aminocyclopropane-1-carboxylate deaminase/D-cysteine desulfhydrase [Ignavibacteriales bacterium]
MKDSSTLTHFLKICEEEIDENAAVVQKIKLPKINNSNVNVFLKREDLIHATISGNKWRKLKYNLIEALINRKSTLLTFGGAYSNHIHATASACKIFGLKTIGIIRGEEHLPLNPTLKFAAECGMQIFYVDRTTYRNKNKESFITELHNRFGDFYLVPEGGTNNLAVKGCTEIINNINIKYDYILSACGTGGTISGLIAGLNGDKNIIGVPVLKGADFLNNDIDNLVKQYSYETFTNWHLNFDFHFGGYAKITKELIFFINQFEEINNIKLDPIYTGKLLFAVQTLINDNHFKENSTILVLHTGGLQGNMGMKNKMDKLLS